MKNLLTALISCFIACLSFSQTDSAVYFFNIGKENFSNRLYSQASGNFEKALRLNAAYTEAYIANGKACLEMRRIPQASENFEKAYQSAPGNMEAVEALRNLYFDNHQFQKAIEFAQKCNGCSGTDRVLGIGYYYGQDYGKAESYLKKAVAADKDADACYMLGRTYLELENEKSAILQYQDAISLRPAQFLWIYELGLIYYSQDDYKNALKCFEEARDKGYMKTNDFYENYGFAQVYSGNTEEGLKTLDTVLMRKPQNTELLNNIANALYETKKYTEALDYFQKLMAINPKDAASLYMAGLTLQKMGQKQKGMKICDHAIAMDPSLSKYRQKKEMQGL